MNNDKQKKNKLKIALLLVALLFSLTGEHLSLLAVELPTNSEKIIEDETELSSEIPMETETEINSVIPMETETETNNNIPKETEAETTTNSIEEEIAAKQALEPTLYPIPGDEVTIPAIADEIEAVGVTKSDEAKDTLYSILTKAKSVDNLGSSGLEARYDPRTLGLVTPVRTQSGNSCWAFSSLGAAEQSLLYQQVALEGQTVTPSTLDLSEGQLLYFFYHSVADPLGNTLGDATAEIHPSYDYISVGSSTIFSTFTLANWVGAAKESLVDLFSLTEDTQLPQSLGNENNVAVLENAYWINFNDTDAVNTVKQMIKQYGGAAINLFYSNNYYNYETNAYYYLLNSTQANNHSVTIVGWDDTYSATNFKEGVRPVSDGAWIVKNSYGTGWGDEGYFYLSYQDSSVNTSNTNVNRARAYIFDFTSASTYDYNYQYDGTSGAYNASYPNATQTRVASGASIANVYHVPQSSTKGQVLEAVSFALYDTAVNYQIQVYKNPTESENPTSGTPLLSTPESGTTSYVGYYTIPLKESVELMPGDQFAVVITLTKDSGNAINFFVDATYQNGNWVSFVNSTRQGQSFRQVNGSWSDLHTQGMSARIKAFTTEAKTRLTSLSFFMDQVDGFMKGTDKNASLSMYNDESVQIACSFIPDSASNKKLAFVSEDPSVVTVDSEGMLTPVNKGESRITITTTDGSNLSLYLDVFVKIRSTKVSFAQNKISLVVGETKNLQATISPKHSSQLDPLWTSEDNSIATVDKKGRVTGKAAGTTVITIALTDGSGKKANCEVSVLSLSTITGEITTDSDANKGETIDATKEKTLRTKGANTDDQSPIATYLLLFLFGAMLLCGARKGRLFK